ncbi:MAG: hypothetical protein RLY31_409 [Bacteroidota bacterium]
MDSFETGVVSWSRVFGTAFLRLPGIIFQTKIHVRNKRWLLLKILGEYLLSIRLQR